MGVLRERMSFRLMLYGLFAAAFTAGTAVADPNYVRRPQGWFMLVPPLTKPDPVTGLRYVDETAPKTKWTGMVIRGYDGHAYDFVDHDTCQAWLSAAAMKFFHPLSGSDQDTFALGWLSKSRCVQDDNRHRVVSDRTQLARMLGME